MEKRYDVVALGELLIDFTQNGMSSQGNPLFEANPGGAPCNVLAMLNNLGRKTAFIGKVGNDQFGLTLKHTLEELLNTLSDRQKQILQMHFGMTDGVCYSLEEIGKQLGISKERARQIEHQAMEKLQKMGASMGLEEYLE